MPVFINQTPDYQNALKKASDMAQYPQPLAAAAHELGLDKELQDVKNSLSGLQAQSQILDANEKMLAVQNAQGEARLERVKHDTASVGVGVKAAAGGTVAAVILASQPARLKWTKLILGGAAAGIASSAAWDAATSKILGGLKQEKTAIAKGAALNQLQEDQLTYQAIALQNTFLETMATRIVEQQKTLVGEGADITLAAAPKTPTEPATAATMAEKYAVPAAGSKTAMLAEQKAAADAAQIAR